MSRIILLLVCLIVPLSVPTEIEASGRYGASKPSAKKAFNANKYAMGKKIFSGQIRLKKEYSGPQIKKQIESLQQIEKEFVKRNIKSKKLSAKASKLSPTQYECLIFFLKTRFKLETEVS